MQEYLTTKEVAQYLRINEKKVYDLVAKGRIPAARVSGKWLFPKAAVDRWIDENTINPRGGVVAALLEQMILMQGSDDPLLYEVIERFQDETANPVLTSRVGSRAGLSALGNDTAHVACCHVDDDCIAESIGELDGCYVIDLYRRSQGLLYDGSRTRSPRSVEELLNRSERFAIRQTASGTYRLTEQIFARAGLQLDATAQVGPFFSHLDVALAIRNDRADVGLGIRWAAEACALDFMPITDERFRLALPLDYVARAPMARFLDYVLSALTAPSAPEYPGYDLSDAGRIQTIRCA